MLEHQKTEIKETIYQAFRKYMLSVTVLLICNILKNS